MTEAPRQLSENAIGAMETLVQRDSIDPGKAYSVDTPRVLIFAFTFPPSAEAGTFRTLRFVRYLSEFGWTPLVLSAKTGSFPEIPTDSNLTASIPATTIVERTSVLRPIDRLATIARRLIGRHRYVKNVASAENSPDSPSSTTVRLLRNAGSRVEKLFSFPDRQVGWVVPAVVAAMRMIREHRPAMLYSSGPPHSSHLAALLVNKLSKVPLALDFRDPWAHCEWTHGRSAFKDWLTKRLENTCVQRANLIILNTESLCRQFRKNYPDALHHKFVTITNGYDPELKTRIESFRANPSANDNQRFPAEFRMCHAGSVYGRRRLEPLVAAIALLNRRGHRIVFEQIGHIVESSKIEQTIALNHAENYVKLTSHRPHDEVMRLMAEADAHVLLQPGTSIQIPGKLFEMIMFGKPIFAIASPGETTNLIRDYDLGIAVDTEDPMVVAAELERLVSASSDAAMASAPALADFDGRFLTSKLASGFDSVLKSVKQEVTV